MAGAAEGAATHRNLLVVSDTLAGGLGATVRLQAEWFAARGWHVTVAAPADGALPAGPARFEEVPPVSSARDAAAGLAARRALARLRPLAGTPAVVHVHGLRSLLFARLARLPTPFVTVHGAHPDATDPPGYARLRRLWLSLVPRLCRRAVTVEPGYGPAWHYEAHASPLLRSLDVLPMPTGTIATIGWLGGLDARKQPEVFVEAIAAVARRGVAVVGLLGGDGPRRAEITALVDRLDAPVEVLGQVDPVEVLRRSCAVALFARSEGTPLAVMEAMWAGRTVVGSALAGIEYLVGDTGTVAGDVRAATVAFEAIARDREATADAGAAAARRVRTLVHADAPWDATEPHYLDYLVSRSR